MTKRIDFSARNRCSIFTPNTGKFGTSLCVYFFLIHKLCYKQPFWLFAPGAQRPSYATVCSQILKACAVTLLTTINQCCQLKLYTCTEMFLHVTTGHLLSGNFQPAFRSSYHYAPPFSVDRNSISSSSDAGAVQHNACLLFAFLISFLPSYSLYF